jgi:hypothetical protein
MKSYCLGVVFILSTVALSGCISQNIDDGGIIAPSKYEWVDDGELVIATYDVYGLTDAMLEEFERQTG